MRLTRTLLPRFWQGTAYALGCVSNHCDRRALAAVTLAAAKLNMRLAQALHCLAMARDLAAHSFLAAASRFRIQVGHGAAEGSGAAEDGAAAHDPPPADTTAERRGLTACLKQPKIQLSRII